MYYENLNLEDIEMPVKVLELVRLLRSANYPQNKIDILKQGFTEGFDIGYQGPESRQSLSDNLPFTIGNKTELWNKLMKEVKLKRVAGPFKKIPFENFIQSPIGLVPKAGNKTRLIFHLSYSFDKQNQDKLGSLNEHTPQEICKVKYKDLDYVIHTYLRIIGASAAPEGARPAGVQENYPIGKKGKPKGKKTVFAGKTDVQSAFRLLPLLKKWLVMKA